jgi:ABC-type amino acid transport substrate-binding protein
VRKLFEVLISVRFLVIVLAALCLANVSLAGSPVLSRVTGDGVLRVGMSVDQPPFNMRAGDKSVIGFDVDLAHAMADAMSVRLEIVEMPFANLLEALVDERVDMVISGVTITLERAARVGFIGPYTLSGKSMLTTARVKDIVKDGKEFNNPEIRLVALAGSTSEIFVQQNLPQASLHAIPNYNEGIQKLLTGQVDAMVADMPILRLSVLRYPEAGLGIIEPPLSIEPIGIAIDREDRQFENLVRNYLTSFEKTGFTRRLHQKWFEDNSWIELLP